MTAAQKLTAGSTVDFGSNNTITCSLALTVTLKTADTSKLTLSGLLNAAGPSAPAMPLAYLTAQHAFGSHGVWSRAAGSLVLTLASDVQRGTLHIFSFSLTNPSTGQVAASVSVAATGTFSMPAQAVAGDSVNATGETGTVAGDAVPLRVYPPTFMIAKIGQSTPFPSATNNITVTLAANVPLTGSPDEFLLLGGLKGSLTPDDSALRIQVSSPAAALFPAAATWDGDVDRDMIGGGFLGIELLNTTVIAAGELMVFSFSLTNPFAAQDAQVVTATWSGSSGFVARIADADTSSILPFPRSVAGDAGVLKVYAPAFVSKLIRQTSVLPGDLNTIHVALASNVPLSADHHTEITIGGIVGSHTGLDALWNHMPNQLPLKYSAHSAGVFGPNASWTRETGQLYLAMLAGATLAAGETCAFSFQLRNPHRLNAASTSLYILSSSTSSLARFPLVAMEVLSSMPLNVTGSVPGDAVPLRVQSPAFMLASVRQLTTFPGTCACQCLMVVIAKDT
jgi:hypothetical protein